MANIYFTGDPHYSHANILKYSKRTLFMNKQEREIMERNKPD
jgi:calcineurin-like phosphoesterase family protein